MSSRRRFWIVASLVALVFDATIVLVVVQRYQALHGPKPAVVTTESSRPDPALPRLGDLTFAARAGTIVVGLSVRPGLPGKNALLVYVESLRGAAANLAVHLSVDGRSLPIRACSPWCRRSTVTLARPARVNVRIDGQGGGTARFQIPRLPAPDGNGLFDLLQERMHALGTYRLREVFNNGTSTIRSTYAFQAPDRFHVKEPSGFAVTWIGDTRYQRQTAGSGWIVQPEPPDYTVPSFIWDYIPDQRFDFRLIGTRRVDGQKETLLSFYGPKGGVAPYWFRLWVDPTGLVLRAQMMSAGHCMKETFNGFNAPITIEPPKE